MYPRSSSPIDVWLLNQSGVSQAFAQINERVQVPTPPLSECSSSGLGEVGVKSEEVEDKPPPDSSSSGLLSRSIAVPDICKTNNKHVQYQATRTNSFLNKSKSKEAVKSLRPFPTNVSSHVPGPGISRKANFNKSPTANKKSKTYIQSSPVSHTSFVFQDIDPNIINGHKPSSKLSPRRFYNEYPSEKKQISKSAVATPYDKICGGNEIQVNMLCYTTITLLLQYYTIVTVQLQSG